MRISFLEIYQEQLEDLLEPSNASTSAKAAGSGNGKGGGMRLVEDAKKGVQVLGLEEVGCADLPAAVALLQRGVKNRMTAATLCNKNSSRSHSVFTLKVLNMTSKQHHHDRSTTCMPQGPSIVTSINQPGRGEGDERGLGRGGSPRRAAEPGGPGALSFHLTAVLSLCSVISARP